MPGEESKSRHVGNLSPYTADLHFQPSYAPKWCSSEVEGNKQSDAVAAAALCQGFPSSGCSSIEGCCRSTLGWPGPGGGCLKLGHINFETTLSLSSLPGFPDVISQPQLLLRQQGISLTSLQWIGKSVLGFISQ